MSELHKELSSLYVERLGLNFDPFDVSKAKPYYFARYDTATLEAAIVTALDDTDCPITVVGDHGIGKTTLLRSIASKLQDQWQFVWLEAKNLGVDAVDERLKQLFYNDLEASPLPKILMVDNAHFLAPEALEHLRLLDQGEVFAIRVIFIANTVIADDMSIIQFAALKKEESEAYIQQKLVSAGYKGTMPLSRDQLSVLYDETQGNFEKINHAMPILLAQLEPKHEASRTAFPKLHLYLLGFLLISVVIGLLIKSGKAPLTPKTIELPLENLATASSELKKIPEPSQLPLASSPVVEKEQGLAKSSTKISDKSSAEISTKVSSTAKAVEQSVPEVDVKPVVELKSAETAKLLESNIASKRQQLSQQFNQSSDSLRKVSSSLRDTLSQFEDGKEQLASKPKALQSKPLASSDVSVDKPSLVNDVDRLYDASALAKWPKNQYALQIVGSTSDAYSKELMKKYNWLALMHYKTERNGKPWYILLSGPYTDYTEAKNAIASLPEFFQRQKPWPRKISAIIAKP